MSTEAPIAGIAALARAALRKYLPYIVAVLAGTAGYTGGQEKLIEKCVGGVTAEQAK